MKKAEILALLREHQGFLSGQELCERFGVSRTAVWKVINQLKKEGYEIEAVQNKGYQLHLSQEIYGEAELTSLLHTEWVGKKLLFYPELNSTNIQAKLEAEKGASHGTLVVTDSQTAGRGRRGRTWESPGGTNLYFTLILRPEIQPQQASMLTLVMADAVGRAIEQETGLQAGIKWPNDIVVNKKKVVGILTEMSLERDYIQYVVVGVGINVGRQEFETELAKKATSLETEAGRTIKRGPLLARVMQEFEADYQLFLKAGDLTLLLDSYHKMLVNRNVQVQVLDPQGDYQGIARGITPKGELLVETEHGIKQVYAGEVSVRGIYGYV